MSAPSVPVLHTFHGGLRLDGRKEASTSRPIQACPLPATLQVPLGLHGGEAADPCVAVGDTVRRGQRIAVAPGRGADIHAPARAQVSAIGLHPEPQIHLSCLPSSASDPQDEWRMPALDPWQAAPNALLERIRAAGIVGLGGAGFPAAEKLSARSALLILNGAECEPSIACDDALLRERAEDVVLGGRLLARLVGAERILLAVEDAMPQASAACAAAVARVGEGQVTLVAVPTVYPEGGERQLIEVLTGREVPRGGLPRDIGVLVHNVATAAAAWRAVVHGEALTHRVVTVAGSGVMQPGNFQVAIGTSVAHLIAQAGGYSARAARLLLGGPMMGIAQPDDSVAIGKQTNCVLVLAAEEIRDAAEEMPCIRCGDCARACPARLQPQQLLWHIRAQRLDRSEAEGVFDCIECGCCDLVCPSHIPLTEQFRQAKTDIRIVAHKRADADAARERYERRNQRLQRESDERALREAERAKQASSGDAIAAALARAKAKRPPRDDA